MRGRVSIVKSILFPVDNPPSYPQAGIFPKRGLPRKPHADGMAQTCTAGDESPQNTQNSQNSQLHQAELAEPTSPGPIRVASPAALLAAIPHLLGFMPEASLVVIGTEPPRSDAKVTLRYDLPNPPGAGVAADMAAHAVGVLRSQQLTSAVAVAYGPEALAGLVADALRDAARRAGLELREFLRVQNGRYWSYVCRDEACCPAAGVPFDASAHAGLAAGQDRVLPDRAAVAARVAPLGGIAAESMRQATRRAERHVSQSLARARKSGRLGAVRHLIASEGLATASAMITAYRAGGRFATDYELARMTVALRDLRVRDDAWARMDPAYAAAHQRLWIDVVRRAQPGHVAAPAALLALAAWQTGHGAMQARPARPRHSKAAVTTVAGRADHTAFRLRRC